jgi:4-amino-4-deoxy-L-arabinose transferase-like glycosyltransferase
MAQSFRAGEGLADELGFLATRMPLYPVMLSLLAGWSYGVVAAKVLHWLIGAVAAALTAGMASTLFDRRVGMVAGLLVACDPFLVFFSSLLLTEAAFVAVLVGLMWASLPFLDVRRESFGCWIVLGLLASLATYVRESSLGLVIALLCFVVVCRRLDRRVLIGAASGLAIVIVTLLPWAMRNKQILGESCWLTTRAGISLYDGVGPQATGASDLGKIKQMPAVVGKNETEWNHYFLTGSIEAMRSDPARILRLAGVKIARMWNPLPNVDTYQSPIVRLLSALWMIPLFVASGVGAILLWQRKSHEGRRLVLFLLLPAIYLTLLHSLFVGSVRYRLGAIPMLEVLAAFALVSLVNYRRGGMARGGFRVTG